MLVGRDWYSSPPPAKDAVADNPTLLVSWWCTGFSLAIILVRVSGRYVRTERLFREDKIMAISIVPLLARMALVHVVLIWGTNNTITDGLAPLDLQHRQVGSKLVLASRIVYAALYVRFRYRLDMTDSCAVYGLPSSQSRSFSSALLARCGSDAMRSAFNLFGGSSLSHSLPWSLPLWPSVSHSRTIGRLHQTLDPSAGKVMPN